MSNRYTRTHTTVLLTVIAFGASGMARQAAPPAAPPQAATPAPAAAGPGNVTLNVDQIPMPVSGTPYRFSLCAGRLLGPGEVSAPCRTNQNNVPRGVSGAGGNSVVTFRLENGSFLPPGLTLDGFGVISGTTNVDLSKLKIKICAIQLGAYGTNFNCKGKPVGFGKDVILTPPPAPAAPPAAPLSPGGGGAGPLLKGLGLAAAATAGVVGYQAYKGASCGPVPIGPSFNSCLAGNCFSCVTVVEELVPWCDCVAAKGLADPSVGTYCRDALPGLRQQAAECEVPVAMSRIPKRAPQR